MARRGDGIYQRGQDLHHARFALRSFRCRHDGPPPSARGCCGSRRENAQSPNSFATKEECDTRLGKHLDSHGQIMKAWQERRAAGKTDEPVPESFFVTCFPDTIDPRGPKGSGR